MGIVTEPFFPIIALLVIGIELKYIMIIELVGFVSNPKFAIEFLKYVSPEVSLDCSVMVPIHWDYWRELFYLLSTFFMRIKVDFIIQQPHHYVLTR